MEKVDQELLGEAHAASCIKGGGGAEKNEVYAVQTAPQSPAPYKSAAPQQDRRAPRQEGPLHAPRRRQSSARPPTEFRGSVCHLFLPPRAVAAPPRAVSPRRDTPQGAQPPPSGGKGGGKGGKGDRSWVQVPPANRPPTPSPRENRDPNNSWCGLCQNWGHPRVRCPKAKCGACHEYGHTLEVCTKGCADCGEKGHPRRYCKKAICGTCSQQGHSARDCKFSVCSWCKETGHVQIDCKKAQRATPRRGSPHRIEARVTPGPQ